MDRATEQQPERWLLVVDVSAPMKNRAPAVREALAGLLGSAMQGQLQKSHELGLWTFNDQLHTELDPFIWDDTRTNEIIKSMLGFVEKQKFSRQTQFSETLTNLQSLVRDSRQITVILFSDGDEAIQGTPYDEAIAAFFQQNSGEARAGKVPLLTVLRGWHGEWIGREQSFPPWPVVFPGFPSEPARVIPDAGMETNAGPAGPVGSTVPSLPRRKVVAAEPLIVRGPDPLSKEIEEKGLATNTAAGNIIIQKPALELAPPEPRTNAVVAIEAPVTLEPATPEPASKPPAPEPAPRPLRFWVGAAAGLLALGLATALLLRRRLSAHRRTSLITRSMNKDGDKSPSSGD
jgi:hypothetical protein